MANMSRDKKRGTDQAIAALLREGVLPIDAIHVGGRTFTQAELADFIEARGTKAQTVVESKAAWKAAILDFKKYDALTEVVLRDLRNVVIGACGEEHPTTGKFGFRGRKKPVMTEEQKAVASQRRKATRQKRKTMGRKQRLAVKGVVPEPAAAAGTPEVDKSGTGTDGSSG
jgi:hypothetical protein